MTTSDTIFALATPPGKSGVAVLRLSGPKAKAALIQLAGKKQWQPGYMQLAGLRNPAGELIDQALSVFFAAPHSFTGEDVAELHIHGSLAVIRQLLAVLSAIDGLRIAEPGEFTRRAFINGKMDLIEAEGLADLIAAETPGQRAQALKQMRGELSHYYEDLRRRVITALAHLEAYIDFPDEEIPEAVLANLSQEIQEIKETIHVALSDHRRGEKLREGVRVVILGAPNAGKSSLLNAIAGRDAAIVSHKAGTTRDIIEVHMDIAGIPVILTDTAGLRDTGDDIEEEGVRRALDRAQHADIKLVVFDSGIMPDKASLELLDNNTIAIANKSDIQISDFHINNSNKLDIINISAKNGSGINDIISKLEEKIAASYSGEHNIVITRARHRALLSQALEYLERFNSKAPLELCCEELRLCAGSIGKITGKIQVDDVLDVIFKQFCIGK